MHYPLGEEYRTYFDILSWFRGLKAGVSFKMQSLFDDHDLNILPFHDSFSEAHSHFDWFFFATVNPAVETRFDYVVLKISSSLTENQIRSCKLSCKVYNA